MFPAGVWRGGEGNNEAMSEKYKNRAEIGAWPAPGWANTKETNIGWSELAPVLHH